MQPRKVHRFGWIPDLPDARDHLYAAPMEALKALPTQVDLRPHCPPVYDQGQLGSCTANAIAGAIHFDRMKEGLQPDYIPSRLFVYFNERVIENTVSTDSGAMIRDGIKSVAKQGACPETEWPYDISKFTVKPPAQAYKDALLDHAVTYSRMVQNINQLKGCLASGSPFIFGFCLHGDTLIHTPSGDLPIRNLVGYQPWVFSWQGDDLRLARASKVWMTQRNVACVKVSYKWWAHGEHKTNSIVCTSTHPFLMLDGSYAHAGDLKPGDRLTPFSQRVGIPGKAPYKRPRTFIKTSGLKKGDGAWQRRSHWIWEQMHGEILKGMHVHHKDGETMNDDPDNLIAKDGKTHIGEHSQEWWSDASDSAIENRNAKVSLYQLNRSSEHENMRSCWTDERRAAQAARMDEINKNRLVEKAILADQQYESERNHRVVSVESFGSADVYDMEVPEFHNFAANNVFVHNSVYESFESDAVAQTGVVPMPSPDEQVLGGHAVMAVGYDDSTQRFIVRNSWGDSWARSGYCVMPYAYITDPNLADDLWTIRLVSKS